ncbi:MAG: hypothetical protein L3J12_00200, partial [Spirochaetales bacterium]|nr:hypothetical protein [Spirochaetales bacterium]
MQIERKYSIQIEFEIINDLTTIQKLADYIDESIETDTSITEISIPKIKKIDRKGIRVLGS